MLKPVEYFEPVLTQPSDYDHASPNYVNAYICASISELCYKGSVGAEHTDQAYKDKVCRTLEAWGWSSQDANKTIVLNSREIVDKKGNTIPGTQGLIVFFRETIFIGFRGSEKKFNDWFTNFRFTKEQSPYVHGRVHRGFLRAFKALLQEGGSSGIQSNKIKNTESPRFIWLTGHSLGGALASVAASYFLNSNTSIAGLYTFGAPRVGDATYRDEINLNLTYKYWRFIHGNDLVCDIPLPTLFGIQFKILPFGFSREGFMLRLTETGPELLRTVYGDGSRKIWKTYDGLYAKDHSMGLYRQRLLDLACQQRGLNREQLEMKLESELYLSEEEVREIDQNKPKRVI